MNKTFARGVVVSAALLAGVISQSVLSSTTKPGDAAPITLKGQYKFGGRTGPFTATLTPTGEKMYDVAYIATFGGRERAYKGTMKGDLDGKISGTGADGNGNFEFNGTFENGTAKCTYNEVGGRGRSGTLTISK